VAISTQVRVVRIFNTYGPNMALDDGRVVSNFVAQALTGQPLTIFGDGQQTRSFQYVSDLIEGEHPTHPLILRRRAV
jgi:UDP-glucuronate decarboxylase